MNSESNGHVSSSDDTLVDRLAKMVAMRADSTVVYGDPVEREGVTIIPVARVRLGFGGGFGRQGHNHTNDEDGGGGGGGVSVTPLGYIELRNGHAEYQPIRNPPDIGRLAGIGAVFGVILVRGLLRQGERRRARDERREREERHERERASAD